MKCKCRGFINNERMPVKYTGFGEDISPEIALEGLPENTVSLAMIMDDLDVPFLPVFTHWIHYRYAFRIFREIGADDSRELIMNRGLGYGIV